VRQFLALELSREILGEIRGLQRDLQAMLAGWRWLDPSGIHLTLRFLGEVDEAVDAAARRGWRAAAASSFRCRVRLEGLGCFPPRGRPSVLWVGVAETGPDRQLARLAANVESAARDAGFEPLRRPFLPHLTLARSGKSRPAMPPDERGFTSRAKIEIDRLTLFRSELLRTGARYTVLDRWPVKRSLAL